MIDALILPAQRRALQPLAEAAVSAGLRPDQVTIAGFVVGCAALPALALQAWPLALLLILLNRFADGLDGAMARIVGPTDRGAFLDIALDFLFYALVPLGFAFANPEANGLAAALLIAAFVGTGSSFLAFAAIAARRGMRAASYPAKGIYYLGGLTEGAETIAIFAAMCLWPSAFPLLAHIFAAACVVTTLTRWHQGWRAFSET